MILVLFSNIISTAKISALHFKGIILNEAARLLLIAIKTPPPFLRNFFGLSLSLWWLSRERSRLNIVYKFEGNISLSFMKFLKPSFVQYYYIWNT